VRHVWKETSGTAETCRKCGCIKVVGGSSANPRGGDRFAQWSKTRKQWTMYRTDLVEPPCNPERGL
jgi:hypothetical protein